MKTIKINLKRIDKKWIDLISEYFISGKIVVFPTDTVYGIGCIAANKKAIGKIFKMKKRKKNQPLLILVNGLNMLKKYCYVSQKQIKYLKTLWPGPISVLFKKRSLLPKELTGGLDSVAVRWPRSKFLIRILDEVQTPIAATSLNINGQPVLNETAFIKENFTHCLPDLVVDAGRCRRTRPSKLIDIKDGKKVEILRK